MQPFKLVRDPSAFELMADETRRRVIYLLRAKEMTVSQIAGELGKTPQIIYRHIRKLVDAELVDIAREEKVDHYLEMYYRASAEVFEFIHGEGGSKEHGEEGTRDALQALGQLGINIRVNDEIVRKMRKLSRAMAAATLKPEQEEKIMKLEGVDFIRRQETARYANLLMMGDKQFEEYLNLQREHRNLLKSALVEPSRHTVKKSRIGSVSSRK